MMTKELEQTIREMIADTLVLEPDEIGLQSRFFQDLGGESLDVLDLSFKVEKRFGVRPPFQGLASSQGFESDTDGRLTRASLEALKQRAPFLNYIQFEQDPQAEHISELLTVDAIIRIVEAALQEKAAQTAKPAV